MNFIYPNFLWALTALAIPIAIHLFNLRRVRKVYFTNVALLKELQQETNSMRRIKEWLVLLSRIGFILFLVLAFCQPFIPSPNQKNITNLSTLVNIYIDNSYSMQNDLGNEKSLEYAVQQSSALIKVFPGAMRFQLMTNLFEVKEQYPMSRTDILDRLGQINYSNQHKSFSQIVNRQHKLLDQYAPNKKNQIFWFSDFQKSTFGKLENLKLDSTNKYYFIPTNNPQTPNVSVDSIWLANPYVKALESNKLMIKFKNRGDKEFKDLVIKLLIDSKQVATASLNLAVNSEVVTEMSFMIDGEGWKACKIQWEDYPIIFDNEYFFVLNAAPTVELLHLTQKQANNNYIQSVYSNEEVFKLTDLNINNLDYNKLSSASVVILDEVENIDGEFKNSLKKYLQEGGILVLFPPPIVNNSLTSFLQSVGVNGIQSVKDTLSKQNSILAVPDVNNPLFKGVFERAPANMEMPQAKASLAWREMGESILKYKNSQSFLSKITIGNGRIFLFAAPLNPVYNDLAKNALFVPLMYQIASIGKNTAYRLAYSTQEKNIRLRVNKPNQNEIFKLANDKTEFVPAQYLGQGELVLDLTEQNLESGHYKLKLNDKVEQIIAFNLDKSESIMDFYSNQELKEHFKGANNVSILEAKSSEAFIKDFQESNIQRSLWKYMLMAALAFLMIEILLIRFIS